MPAPAPIPFDQQTESVSFPPALKKVLTEAAERGLQYRWAVPEETHQQFQPQQTSYQQRAPPRQSQDPQHHRSQPTQQQQWQQAAESTQFGKDWMAPQLQPRGGGGGGGYGGRSWTAGNSAGSNQYMQQQASAYGQPPYATSSGRTHQPSGTVQFNGSGLLNSENGRRVPGNDFESYLRHQQESRGAGSSYGQLQPPQQQAVAQSVPWS